MWLGAHHEVGVAQISFLLDLQVRADLTRFAFEVEAAQILSGVGAFLALVGKMVSLHQFQVFSIHVACVQRVRHIASSISIPTYLDLVSVL